MPAVMPRQTQGFTFIELLLVVSIICILAAIAIPAYSDYVHKAQIAEAWLLSLPLKQAVTDQYAHTGRLPTDNRQAGLLPADQYQGAQVRDLEVRQGVIRARFSDPDLGGVLEMIPEPLSDVPGMLVWHCASDSLPAKLLGSHCRK
jgi:type IV pilus assembly protein PilA